VTFESRPGGQADNVGVDFSRLQQGTLEVYVYPALFEAVPLADLLPSFNGRSGWIRDADREVYFERSNLMNSSRNLEASKTKVSHSWPERSRSMLKPHLGFVLCWAS
jgi:hypothetical protein